jgi:hypothetical protein
MPNVLDSRFSDQDLEGQVHALNRSSNVLDEYIILSFYNAKL